MENPFQESNLEMDKEPFAIGRSSHIYRATYKGLEVVVKRMIGNKDELKETFYNEVLLLT
jgi:hypothetical protein